MRSLCLPRVPLLLLAIMCFPAPAAAQGTPPAPVTTPAASAAADSVVLPADFVRRRQAGRGYFATREQIARRHPAATLNVFAAAPGVRLVPDGAGGMRVQMSRGAHPNRELPATVSPNRGLAMDDGRGRSDDGEPRMTPAGTARTPEGAAGGEGGEECRVQYYRNGLRYLPDRESHVSRDIPVATVEAVEVYRTAAETPPEFRGAGADCGVIVVWTAVRTGP